MLLSRVASYIIDGSATAWPKEKFDEGFSFLFYYPLGGESDGPVRGCQEVHRKVTMKSCTHQKNGCSRRGAA